MSASKTRKTDHPRRDHAAEITSRIVELIEAGETLPWRCPWRRSGASLPTRVTGEAYRGINSFFLALLGQSLGYASPVWMTFRQAKDLGGAVRKGEKSAPVVYYGVAAKDGADSAAAPGPAETGAETEAGEGSYRFLKGYAVFNTEQIDGLPERFAPLPEERLDTGARPIEEIEAFMARLPVKVATGGDRAFYRETGDLVQMPGIARFEDPSRYYAVMLHEMAHASGIESRLDRPSFAKYHDDRAERAREELVAEIASAIAGPRLDLPTDHVNDHAAYIQSWLAQLKSDSRYILKAAADAQRAVDWIFAAAGETARPADSPRAAADEVHGSPLSDSDAVLEIAS